MKIACLNCLYNDDADDSICPVCLHDITSDEITVAPIYEQVLDLRAELEAARAEARHEDGDCVDCGKPTKSISGRPSEWPIRFCEPDGTGINRIHHEGCLMKRLRRLAELETRLQRQPLAVAEAVRDACEDALVKHPKRNHVIGHNCLFYEEAVRAVADTDLAPIVSGVETKEDETTN